MFISFFYLIREYGLKVSLNEWMVLMEALEKGLHNFSVYGLYELCRHILVKRESDYDTFDLAFMNYFGDIAKNPTRELPEELLDWLKNDAAELLSMEEIKKLLNDPSESMEEVLKRFEKILAEQTERHDGGRKWIGTNGYTPFGNAGKRLGGMRVGGHSMYRSAFMVASERRYKDFRKDNTLDTRQFQIAFRKLRQLSEQSDESKTEFDVDATIRETGDNAGSLKIVYKRPRRNSIKVLLLMDSGGSMSYYSRLCSMLFSAATKSNCFKDLRAYYFHNCVTDSLYSSPSLWGENVEVDRLFSTYDSEYRVIFVGDAMMAPVEFEHRTYSWRTNTYSDTSGYERLLQFKEKYPYLIWLNPQPRNELSSYWAQTYDEISNMIDMYDLTVAGLEDGIKRLLDRSKR